MITKEKPPDYIIEKHMSYKKCWHCNGTGEITISKMLSPDTFAIMEVVPFVGKCSYCDAGWTLYLKSERIINEEEFSLKS